MYQHTQFDVCVEKTYQRWRFSQWTGPASGLFYPLMLTQRAHSASCYLILPAGRSEYWPGEKKGMLFRIAEA